MMKGFELLIMTLKREEESCYYKCFLDNQTHMQLRPKAQKNIKFIYL